MVDVGTQAPNFNLHKSKSEKVELESLRGKNVILAFFPAAFTGICEKELCSFRDAHSALKDFNAEVYGISVNDPFTNAAFSEKNGLGFALLSDYTRSAIRAYGVDHDDFDGMTGYTAAKRSVFVIDKEGIIRFAWIAPNPGVEPDYEAVKAAVAELK